MRAIAIAMILCAARLDAQAADWLRPVATINVAVSRVLAADVAPDGSKIVTVDEHRDVVVHAFEPWREVSCAVVAGKAVIDDVRFDRDGTHVVVTMPYRAKEPAQVFAVADGARVEGPVPELPAIDATPPPGMAEALVSRQESVRCARDGRTAVFGFFGNHGVWRGAALQWLSPYETGIALTADGMHLVVTRTTRVDVHSVAGGPIWSLPIAFGEAAATAPFGADAAFVCVDAENIVVADAAQRRGTASIRVDSLGLKWTRVQLVAASADGQRLVVTATSSGARDPATHLVDLRRGKASPLPLARCSAAFGAGGILLLDGETVTCGVLLHAKFTWVPDDGTAESSWAPAMAYANGALLPDRAEVVHLAPLSSDKSILCELRRCDAASGRVLAKIDIRGMPSAVAPVGGHVVVFDAVPTDPRGALTLRRPGDLAVVASSPLARTADQAFEFCAAAAAPRLAWSGLDKVAVFDVVLPPDRAADSGTGRK